jgi:Cft2 family RNA processing exonuclease
MDWDVRYRDGIHLPQIGWSLDSRRRVERCFVSHAHFDHLARHREILCSPTTAHLAQVRLRGRRTVHALPFGRTESLSLSCAVTLHPAGHIAGSAMILLEDEQLGSLLYTGDFKLRPGLAAEACAVPRADLLIMETTFGRERYSMPPAEAVWADIVTFCRETLSAGGIPVLFAYSLGKAQEVIAGLGRAGFPLMLHREVERMTRACEACGWKFPEYMEFDSRTAGGYVVVCPPQGRQSAFIRRLPGASTAVVTGWAIDSGARWRSGCDAAFPLSDHADFPDLLRFVEEVRPKRVLTLHGFAADFASELRRRGHDARALSLADQLDLALA